MNAKFWLRKKPVCSKPVQSWGLPVTSYFLSSFLQTFGRVFNAACVNTPRSLFAVAFTLLLPFIIYKQIGSANSYPIKKWRWVQSAAVWFLLFAETFWSKWQLHSLWFCKSSVVVFCSRSEQDPFPESFMIKNPQKTDQYINSWLFLVSLGYVKNEIYFRKRTFKNTQLWMLCLEIQIPANFSQLY